jgi:SAM-dependent methyltransferase
MQLPFQLEHLWKRTMLRGTAFTGAYRKLSLLYTMEDPWDMESAREQHRFSETHRLLAAVAARFDSILELGAGEGHQSLYLSKLTDELHGLELSTRAVARARRRCPSGQFVQGRLEDLPRLFEGRVFDLVTACEVLYYVQDLEAAIALIQSHADRLFVSNYQTRAEGMRAAFGGPGWQRMPDIIKGETVWECHLWERPVEGQTEPC